MGLADDLLKNVGGLGGIASLAAKNPQLLSAAATLLSSKDGSVGGTAGLAGLVSAFDKNGLGNIMASWVGTGKNQSIGADQITKVLGNDTLKQFAGKAGIGLAEAGPALAAVLPSLVDSLTPQGRVPEASSLEGALGKFLSGAA
jgi:uncharacterized protein YidB (DUF937 family)